MGITSISTLSLTSPEICISSATEGAVGWLILTSGGSPNSSVTVVNVWVAEPTWRRFRDGNESSATILKWYRHENEKHMTQERGHLTSLS